MLPNTETKPQRRPRRTSANDPRFDLHKRLDRLLDDPTSRSHLDALVYGLVDYELKARLSAILPPAADEGQHG